MVIIVIKTLCYAFLDLCFLSIGRGGKITRELFYQRIHLRGNLARSEEYKQVVLVSCLLVGLSKVRGKIFQYGAIFRFVCFLSCPFGKFLFRLALKFSGLVSGKRIDHSLAIFPVVSQARISRCILETYSIVRIHVFFHGIHSCFGGFYPSRIAILHLLVYPIGRHPTVGTTWVAQDHSKILLLYPFEAYIEVFLRFHRDIIRRVFCRISIFIGIYAENREITCMAWPLPVVGITSEFSYIFRRGTH